MGRRCFPGDQLSLEPDDPNAESLEIRLESSLGWGELFEAVKIGLNGEPEFGVMAMQPNGKFWVVQDFRPVDESEGWKDGEGDEQC